MTRADAMRQLEAAIQILTTASTPNGEVVTIHPTGFWIAGVGEVTKDPGGGSITIEIPRDVWQAWE